MKKIADKTVAYCKEFRNPSRYQRNFELAVSLMKRGYWVGTAYADPMEKDIDYLIVATERPKTIKVRKDG